MVIGYIYKIYDNTNGSVYYGSTKETISRRMAGHRASYNRWVAGKARNCKSFDIIKNGDYAYSLVEQVEYDDKLILHQRERFYIENNECVNMCIPNRTQKEWEKKFKREYYLKNWEKLQAYQKEYRKKKNNKMSKQK